MSNTFAIANTKAQTPLSGGPYDQWMAQSGEVMAEFYRDSAGFRIRFPDQSDFIINSQTFDVMCEPAPGASDAEIHTLWHNAIVPLLDNYRGDISLHGSACLFHSKAIGFVGASRRGKTTLAAACAKMGNPFLAEDAIRLRSSLEEYLVQPARPLLRLFGDSAAFLEAATKNQVRSEEKVEVASHQGFAHCREEAPLHTIYVLGDSAACEICFTPMGKQQALAELMRHAFILDIEDKARLAAHFDRLAQLVRRVPVVQIDYPRQFEHLSKVVAALEVDAADR